MSDFATKLKLWMRIKTKSFAYRFMKVPDPEKWVFIIGCYNSGTTLLHKLLSAHPEIGSMPNEGQFYTDQLPGGAKFNLPRLWALKPDLFYIKETSKPPIDVRKLKRQWAWFYNDRSKKVLIEKTILNSARSRWLQKNFKNSYFIIIFRNGYAVAEGIHRKEKHEIGVAALQWSVSNEILLKDMEYLQKKHVLKYEELVADPVNSLKSITDFLGLSPLEESVFLKEFNIHKMQSGIKDMNVESINRLTEEEIEEINKTSKEVLSKLNYTIISPDRK